MLRNLGMEGKRRSDESVEVSSMSISVLPPHDYPDTIARPVVGLKVELAFAGETEPHKHRKDQLLYVIEGLITVAAEQGVWTVPPQCAI